MVDRLNNLKESISYCLAIEKSYNLPAVCQRYGLADGKEGEAFRSKSKYVKARLVDKDQEFLIELGKRLIKDYQSTQIGMSLNELLNKKFYKLTEVTRRKLVEKLLEQKSLSGKLSSEEFLIKASLSDFIQDDSFSYFFDNTEKKSDPLIEFLEANHFYELLDSQIFNFIELLVHPIVRNENMVENYLNILNKIIKYDKLELIQHTQVSGSNTYKIIETDGVSGEVKNLIFASNGYKPEIVIGDALNNDIQIVKNKDSVLVYNKSISPHGLKWIDLVEWWAKSLNQERSLKIAKSLKSRLDESLDSKPERELFNYYYSQFGKKLGKELPALIPQVYLHYDPYTVQKHGIQYLLRQRMDFLILFSNSKRVVIEVDGKQHYSDGETSSPSKYSEMVRLDRELKLLNYDIYRLGGYELTYNLDKTLSNFFSKLFEKYL